jgi:hypothetical protein
LFVLSIVLFHYLIMMFIKFSCVTIALLLSISVSHCGPMTMALIYTACNSAWVACVTAAGGIAGVTTGGVGVPAAIVACNVANGVCMSVGMASLVTPVP